MDHQIRSQFAATGRYAYLNSAAVAPMPLAAIDAVASQMTDVALHGSSHYTQWVETKERCRVLLSAMLGVRAEEIGFIRNTSDGFASIANGLPWQSGDNIVSFAGEFPANYYAWKRIRDQFGVELRLAGERDGRVDIDELITLIDSDTKVVALSAVQFASGFAADLERVGKAARAVDALFCVDVIQGLGARGYDLDSQYVDAACGASHKWLCAPEGCGYIYLSERARSRITPTMVGWISVEDPWDFIDREQELKPNALAWESGTGPASLFYGFEQSLRLLTDTGLERIERYLDGLSTELCERLAGTEYDIVSPRGPGERSAIVCIRHRGGLSPNQIAKALADEDVIVSPRTDRLRVATHFFNNSSDISRLIEALP